MFLISVMSCAQPDTKELLSLSAHPVQPNRLAISPHPDVLRVTRVTTLLLARPRVHPAPLVNPLLLRGQDHAATAPLVNTLVVATPRVPTAPLGQPLVQLVHNTCVATAPLVNTLLLAPPRVPTATLVTTLLLAPASAHRCYVL